MGVYMKKRQWHSMELDNILSKFQLPIWSSQAIWQKCKLTTKYLFLLYFFKILPKYHITLSYENVIENESSEWLKNLKKRKVRQRKKKKKETENCKIKKHILNI